MTKALPHFIQCHERWLHKNGNNGFYFGDSITYPDLVLLNWVRLLTILGLPLDDNSPIKKLENTIKALPEWKEKYDDFSPISMIDVNKDQ